jgi:two-component system, NarL family, nitrate/nitrite response regulator NarL
MTAKARILIVDDRCLFREGLKCVLREQGFEVEAEERCFTAALQRLRVNAEGIDLLLGDPGARLDEELEAASAICRQFPGAKVVLLTDRMTPAWLERAAKVDAAGFLLHDISPEALKHSLNLVLTGEQIVPTATPRDLRPVHQRSHVQADDSAGDMLAALAGRELPAEGRDDTISRRTPSLVPYLSDLEGEDAPSAACASLSAREKQILDCLAGGLSNKLIARKLDMAEATVKVHVRTLLRKLKAKNRTQAAILSLRSNGESNGIARPEGLFLSEAIPGVKPNPRRAHDAILERSPGSIPIRGTVAVCKLPGGNAANRQ